MNTSQVRLVVPHDVLIDGAVAVVTLPATGAVHRLVGPAATVVRRLAAGDRNPALWSRDEQDAVAILCDLGVLQYADHDVKRRSLIAGAAALGITTIVMPTAVAAASGEGSGGGATGGRIEVLPENSPTSTLVSGESLVQWTSGSSDFIGFRVVDDYVPVTYLTVGGGSGGGGTVGGGGAGGQVRFGSTNFLVGDWNVRVGSGGAAWGGWPSGHGMVGMITNLQLGFTSTGFAANGANWPSNGYGGPGGSVTFQGVGGGFSGGTGSGNSPAVAGGGGAGAGGNGGNSSGTTGGNGGIGVTISDFFATSIDFGGGGGGGGTGTGGSASHGGGTGGSSSMTATAGTANRGGGGGGSGGSSRAPGAGGSGIVAIRTAASVTMPG